jgi:curved DNA-binding protein CbpA
MENYYGILGITESCSTDDIKKAFRERAKRLHPDIAGQTPTAEQEMRRLLAAYRALMDEGRRFEYDRAYRRFARRQTFDYRAFLRERRDDPESQARLVFFELLHMEDDEAVRVWQAAGNVRFPMEKYLEREDWMDCVFMLAEELEKRQYYYEAFVLMSAVLKEERRLPYFRHFAVEAETFVKELVRLRLKPACSAEQWIECLEVMLGLGFSAKDEARYLLALAQVLAETGEESAAAQAFREAQKRDRSIRQSGRLKKIRGML